MPVVDEQTNTVSISIILRYKFKNKKQEKLNNLELKCCCSNNGKDRKASYLPSMSVNQNNLCSIR